MRCAITLFLLFLSSLLAIGQSPRPIARTDVPNTFLGQQTFKNFVDIRREHSDTYQLLTFTTEDSLATNDFEFFGMGYDMSHDGGFFVLAFDGVLQADLIQIGTSRPGTRGHFGIWAPPTPEHMLNICDSLNDPNVNLTMNIYSRQNGIFLSGPAAASDRLTIDRIDNQVKSWLTFHQGSGVADWRIGFDPVGYGYDLVFYNGMGEAATAENPGTEVFRITTSGEIAGPTITRLKNQVSDLQAIVANLLVRINLLEHPPKSLNGAPKLSPTIPFTPTQSKKLP
jgi:hypothetical protein